MNLILEAAELARISHMGQFRKYSFVPYIIHPARVAGRVAILPYATEELVAAAFLHDTLEDTDLTVREIERKTGSLVVFYVEWMTNRPKDPGLSRAQRKHMDRERLSEAPDEVKVVKMLDRIDNLRDLQDAPPDFRRLYGEESLLLADVLGGVKLLYADSIHCELMDLAKKAASS